MCSSQSTPPININPTNNKAVQATFHLNNQVETQVEISSTHSCSLSLEAMVVIQILKDNNALYNAETTKENINRCRKY